MPPVILLVVGIGIPLLILLCLFFVPVITCVVLGKTPVSSYYLFEASWGWIGARVRTDGGGARQELLLGGRPFYSWTGKDEEARAPGGEEEPGEEPRARFLLRRIPHLLRLIQPISELGREILHRTTLEEVRGRMRVGFQDPAETGILYGWYWAILPSLALSRVSLDVTPVFDREVLEGEVMARIRIDRPLLILLAMARIAMDRDVRVAFRGLREG